MDEHLIYKALKDRDVVSFVRESLLVSYVSFFPLYEKEVKIKLKLAFSLLEKSVEKKQLRSTINKIHEEIFENKKKDSWFSVLYRNYKMQIRSKVDYQKVAHDIKGKVLDFGSNGGYYALELKRQGFDVYTTDVLDCRDISAKDLPFIKMQKPNEIPTSLHQFDTTIIKTVFHHIKDKNLLPILASLEGLSKKLIIKEDIFGVTFDDFLESNLLEKDQFLSDYIKLGKEKQFLVLVLVDFFGNILAHGIDNMELSFNFKTLNEWKTLLSSVGFKTTKVIWYGFDSSTKLHQNLQAWIICER